MDILVKSYSAALLNIEAVPVVVELSHTPSGHSSLSMVGLPDVAVRESWDRVITAIRNSGYDSSWKRVVINLSPGDLKKEGTVFDLPIAVAMIASTETKPFPDLQKYLLVGELSLDGLLQPIRGALSIALMARDKGFAGVILPESNAEEAAVVQGIEIYGAQTLKQVVEFLRTGEGLQPTRIDVQRLFAESAEEYPYDFREVKGQESVVRALEVAAAGGHNVILVGPPGSGKSMMAKRMPSILPPLSLEESLETTQIYSVAGELKRHSSLLRLRPFRSPHHTISNPALVGGGVNPRPGEISLAHHGVLFLDEIAEFHKSVLELLRQPLEDRQIVVARAKATFRYPASFMLFAAMNPCPCGYYNDPKRPCTCAPGVPQKYWRKLSGPLMDRIDIQLETRPVEYADLASRAEGESSWAIRQRVIAARALQKERYQSYPKVHCNAQMTPAMIRKFAILDPLAQKILKQAMEQMDLSARAYDRILKVARTIADLAGKEVIDPGHITEAIMYRKLDRSSWGE